MVSADIIKDLWKGVVEAHRAGLSFDSNWTAALDERMDASYPLVLWKPPTSGVVVQDSGYAYDTFGVDMLFLDDMDSDRTPEQRDQTYARMDTIAKQCFYRFRQLYVRDSVTYQGVVVDLGIETNPVFTAVYDEAAKMTTGVRMTVTLKNNVQTPCMDGYFS